MYKVFGTESTFAILSPSLRGMPFSGVEWTYQARDLGFKEEIESDEEDEIITSQSTKIHVPEELEMSDLSMDGSLKKVHQVKGSASSSLDSIMEDNDIKL